MKFYGVYGKNGGGVYTDWTRVLETKKYVDGIKNKAFRTKTEASFYVINGLENDYGVVEQRRLSVSVFENKNWFYRLEELDD